MRYYFGRRNRQREVVDLSERIGTSLRSPYLSPIEGPDKEYVAKGADTKTVDGSAREE